MPKPILDDIINLPDALQGDAFELVISPPPAIMSGTEARLYRLQLLSTALPGRTIEEAVVSLFGYEVAYAGRNIVEKQFTATYFETRQFVIKRVIDRWQELCRSRLTGTGLLKKDYACTAVLNMFDTTGALAGSYEMLQMWPTQAPQIALDGGSTNVIQMQVTFRIDEMRPLYDGGAGS